MRPVLLALLAGAALAPAARAGDLRYFDDAALHAVQFVDELEGWAVGDEGVVWHTYDGGKNWERQPTGVRASLRSVYFLDAYTGWIAGREELPHGAGSVGVLLYTRDAGVRWHRLGVNAFPGLNHVRFVDARTGFALGDGSDPYPAGVFRTLDGGRTWQPLPGPRCPAWLAGSFQDRDAGALAGAWGRAMTLRQGALAPADVDDLAGRTLHGLLVSGRRGIAVGQGGLVLVSKDSAGARWGPAALPLSAEVRADWDFHAVAAAGEHVWAVGRPGSAVLHSPDRGQTWEVQKTGQPLPLDGVCFLNERQGWAVGELGTVLRTADGGQSWQVQRRGGEQAAVLFVNARPAGLPVDTVAQLGGEDGYLVAAVRVLASDPASAAPGRASEGPRFAAAVRRAGGAAGEALWQFPMPQHLIRADRRGLMRAWDRLHDGRAGDDLLGQLVLALRTWRPRVVVTDDPDPQAGFPAEALLAEALDEAFKRAGDPAAFPEQLRTLGLKPWQADKLYARWHGRSGAHLTLDGRQLGARLGEAAREFAAPAADLLTDLPWELPPQRSYRLLASRLDGAAEHRGLTQGLPVTQPGVDRRPLSPVEELSPEKDKALQARRNFQLVAGALTGSGEEVVPAGLADPGTLLGRLGPALAGLKDDQAAPAAFALANQYVRTGQWPMAREVFLLVADRYPGHPLAADAYRWLVRYHSSSEARRRYELGQFVLTARAGFGPAATSDGGGMPPAAGPLTPGGAEGNRPLAGQVATPGLKADAQVQRALAVASGGPVTQDWFRQGVEAGTRLTRLGPLFADDPSVQFCLQAARRNLGDQDGPRQWYQECRAAQAEGPWRDAAAAELWLANRSGPPPKPVAHCRQTDMRPFLDGRFDDACWQGLKPVVLRNAVGRTVKEGRDEQLAEEYPTEVLLAYDREFLYVALRCRHPADRYVERVKVRPRDADLRPYDRVSLLIDLDRDYHTYYQLQVDQRGCVCEDCWGDFGWNPSWFVAVQSERSGWQVEAAVPLSELTGESVPHGHVWAFNVTRVLPGRGVQAWSLPADVQPRPEGMGLLMFQTAR